MKQELKERFEEKFWIEAQHIENKKHLGEYVWNFFSTEIDSLLDKIEIMIAEEMLIAQKEGQPTSRLTSLVVRLGGLKSHDKGDK